MQYITWSDREGRWRGVCPRCGHKTFFETKHLFNSGNVGVETLLCPDGHAVLVEYMNDISSKPILSCSPVDYVGEIPAWLPELYKPVYEELLVGRRR